jgi:hypothetical protein
MTTKVKKPFAYYMAMKDYQIVKKEKSLNVITSLLIIFEYIVVINNNAKNSSKAINREVITFSDFSFLTIY